jgi:hypothetical protein
MQGLMIPLLWAQAAGAGTAAGTASGAGAGTGAANPAALAYLAFRRWCSGLTLSSPESSPSLDGLWAFLAGLSALLVVALLLQGPLKALKQLLDVPGHVGLVRRATRRVWRAGRVVAAAITFTVLSWTGSQTLGFLTDRPDRGKAELILLTKSRARLELALEHGLLAGLTPLRDLSGLADNMPLLIFAVYLVFRASAGMLPPVVSPLSRPGRAELPGRPAYRSKVSGWSTLIWGCGALYVLYRLVARAAGSADLPLGGCLVAEAALVPLMMLLCDGFLLAWVLAEIRNAGFDDPGDERLHPGQALELMPAAALACALALPARYVATFVFLGSQHLSTSASAGAVGRYIRWQLGWGLVDLQAAALLTMGVVGVVAWSRGSIGEALGGLIRLLKSQAGYLAAALAMAGAAACLLAGLAYAVVLLLPPASWVLPAADSYAHYVTLPVGLWTVAALIELTERSLPVAIPVRDAVRTSQPVDIGPYEPAGMTTTSGTGLGDHAEIRIRAVG